MIDFNSSLLREKFSIKDVNGTNRTSMVALSNRMVLELTNNEGEVLEKLIVRSHNMHSCIRMSARIIQAFIQSGPILHRHNPFNWQNLWDRVVDDYEKTYNPDRWIAVYYDGKPVYEWGERHPLLDMIEKCDSQNDSQYEYSLTIAEESFKKAGKDIALDYDGNVAMVTDFNYETGKCAFILRRPDKTTTFSFTAMRGERDNINIAQCLTAGAALLEGVQIAFMVGMNNEKISLGKIERGSDEAKQNDAARKRLGRLGAEVVGLENTYEVRYRPEKPEFQEIVTDAEHKAQKIFEEN